MVVLSCAAAHSGALPPRRRKSSLSMQNDTSRTRQASTASTQSQGVGGRSPPGWVGGDAAQPRRGVRGRSPLEPHKRATPARLALCEPCPRDAPSVRRAPLNHAKAPRAYNYKGTQNKNRVMGFERAEDLTSLGIFAYGEVPTGDTCLHDALRGLSGQSPDQDPRAACPSWAR